MLGVKGRQDQHTGGAPEGSRAFGWRRGNRRDEGEVIRIESRDDAIRRVQCKVRERFGEGRSLSEELIAERREEAEELRGGYSRG